MYTNVYTSCKFCKDLQDFTDYGDTGNEHADNLMLLLM